MHRFIIADSREPNIYLPQAVRFKKIVLASHCNYCIYYTARYNLIDVIRDGSPDFVNEKVIILGYKETRLVCDAPSN